MTKIRFTSTPKIPHDMAEEWEGYVKDSVHEMTDVEVDRWIRRGVAEVVREEKVKPKEEKVIQSTTPKVVTSPTSSTSSTLSSSSPNPSDPLNIPGGKSTSV